MPAFHVVTLDPYAAPAQPSLEPVASLSPVEWHPCLNVMAGQDTLCGPARRTIASFGLEGSGTWPWDETGDPEVWPLLDEWRVVGRHAARLTPGNYLRLHVLYVPSGMTRVDIIGISAPDQPDGWIRVAVTWLRGMSSTAETYDVQLPAVAPDGLLPTGSGAAWGQLRELELLEILPPDVDDDAATAEEYSEGVRATFTISIRGGARVIDAVLVEHPLRHVQAHDSEEAVSCHAAVQGGGVPLIPMTRGPQTDRADAVVYEDRRFGSHQLLRVAHQQAETLGPRLLSWSPWSSDGESYEQLNTLGEDDVEPVRVTGTTALTEILNGTAGYDPDRPGWLVYASHAQLHRYCDPDTIMVGGGRAVVPVRVIVRAHFQEGEGGPGTRGAFLRLQSSATEWIDVPFRTHGIQTVEVVGWLESQVAADHAVAVLQALVQLESVDDHLDVYGLDIDWGWTP